MARPVVQQAGDTGACLVPLFDSDLVLVGVGGQAGLAHEQVCVQAEPGGPGACGSRDAAREGALGQDAKALREMIHTQGQGGFESEVEVRA